MTTGVCAECLRRVASLDGGGVCGACRVRLRLETAYGTGWRAGWHACELFFGIDRETGEVSG